MHKKRPISSFIMRGFALTTLVAIIVCGLLLSILLFSVVGTNAQTGSLAAINRADTFLELVIKNTQNISNMICFNSSVQNALASNVSINEYTLNEASERNYEMRALFNSAGLYSDFINNVVIFNSTGNYFTSMFRYNENSVIMDNSWYANLTDSMGQNIWIESHYDKNDYNNPSGLVISAVRKIRKPVDNSTYLKDIGFMALNIQESEFHKLISQFRYAPDSDLFILNGQNMIVSHDNKDIIGQTYALQLPAGKSGSFYTWIDNRRVLLTYVNNRTTGWTIVELTGSQTVFQVLAVYLQTSLITVLLLFLIFFIVSGILSKSLSRPIKALQKQMAQVETGDFNLEMKPKVNISELDSLMQHFNVMVFRLTCLIDEVCEAKIRENELEVAVNHAEIEALQQQINPHFLYNALDSINWMASLNATDEVSKMVIALSEFYRFSINCGVSFISIDDEIKNTNNYIYLQKIRFGQALTVQFNLQDGVGQYYTFKLLLQPLVENTIKHCLEASGDSCTVNIDISMDDQRVFISVSDNGPGMEQATIDAIMTADTTKTNVGLTNIIRRLGLVFGSQYSFVVESTIGVGTKISISFPKILSEADIIRFK
jgi:two-component system sensor histidine kinase YesM